VPAQPKKAIITRAKVDQLEKVAGQLEGMHSELSALAKKSPNDGVNKFKLKFVNSMLADCIDLLGGEYSPFEDFQEFNPDDVPSNSDVTFIVAQYIQALEKFRSDNINQKPSGWYYNLAESENPVRAAPPAKLTK